MENTSATLINHLTKTSIILTPNSTRREREIYFAQKAAAAAERRARREKLRTEPRLVRGQWVTPR